MISVPVRTWVETVSAWMHTEDDGTGELRCFGVGRRLPSLFEGVKDGVGTELAHKSVMLWSCRRMWK